MYQGHKNKATHPRLDSMHAEHPQKSSKYDTANISLQNTLNFVWLTPFDASDPLFHLNFENLHLK